VQNTACGAGALEYLTTGINNTACGYHALNSSTTSSDNIGLGSHAAYNNTTGGNNIAIGSFALNANTTTWSNTAIGHSALRNYTGSDSVAVGAYALERSISDPNIAIGTSVLNKCTGAYNVAIGVGTCPNSTTARENTSIGSFTLTGNITGSYNACLGTGALENYTDNYSTAVGNHALQYLINGTTNIALGYQAGTFVNGGGSNTSATSSVYLGANAKASAAAQTNEIVVGYGAVGLGSNTAIIGTASTTITELFGKIGINTATPTARMHLPAGTIVANTAPLKFVAGPILTIPEAGTIEFDGSNFFMTV